MNTKELLEAAYFFQAGLGLLILLIMRARRSLKVFPHLGWLLAVETFAVVANIAFLFFRRDLHLSRDQDYWALFLVTYIAHGLALVLRVLIVYSVFAEAMRPLAGLHQAGKMIFRWVGVVSFLVASALVAGPGVFSSVEALTNTFSRLQQGVSVLTLCLLVFVCFAVRPLGLTFRSHIFGVSLGLGISSTVELVQAAWIVTTGGHSVYSPIYLVSAAGFCVALFVWGTYFAMPEPARKMILLPTTSPFFFWNRISEILGDSPGHVAVAGFTPDMLAPAEIEMLTAATSTESVELEPSPSRPPAPAKHVLPEIAGVRRPQLAL